MINLESLEGKTIKRVFIDDTDNHFICLEIKGERTLILQAEGDCCSETWFHDIIGIDAILNQKILSIRQLDLPEVIDGHTRQEYDKFYGIEIGTIKGICTIAFRNSSNGYYGGWIEIHNSLPFVLTKISLLRWLEKKWKQLTKDWSAF